MSLQAVLARIAGDTWRSWRTLAIWPWPAICIGSSKVKFDWSDYRRFGCVLQPGDFLLMRADRYFLSNRGISGSAFKHLAVYTGACSGERDQETGEIRHPKSLGKGYQRSAGAYQTEVFDRTVTHAVSEGVICQDLGEVLFHEDYVAAVRPWATEVERLTIVDEALKQVGKAYNFDFTQVGPPELYCTELGEFCCLRAGIIAPSREMRVVDWRGMLFPGKKYKAPVALADKFALDYTLVAISKQCDNRRFWAESDWADDLRRRILECVSGT